MRIDKVNILNFKNLKNFSIDFNEEQTKSVLLGQNATGKSNFIEALVLIFKYLDLKKEPPKQLELEYSIQYICKGHRLKIEYSENKYLFYKFVEEKTLLDIKDKYVEIKKNTFFESKEEYLPKYVFTYYSGISNRLKDHFNEHQKRFYDKIIKPNFDSSEVDSLRRLFYVQAIHSHYVLLAYYSFQDQEKKSSQFLKNIMGIDDIESILFIIKKPSWKGKGDERFFGSGGMVQEFLAKVWDLSIAPIYNTEREPLDFRRDESLEKLYLYIQDKAKLKELAKQYKSNTEFFKALESLYISDLIYEVKIKIKKKFVGKVIFKELSEGEQQLLTVLGLLKFTKDEESLILLDEPDTHLNPLWKWKYLEFLDDVVQNEKNTHIIINTHDPLVIGGLKKEQVRVFRTDSEGKIISEQPEDDPQGMGVDGILTSDLFGLPSTLDEPTQKLLDERNDLLVKENSLSKDEKARLNEIYNFLNNLGMSNTFRDPMFQKFIKAYKARMKDKEKPFYSKSELQDQNRLALEIIKELEAEQK